MAMRPPRHRRSGDKDRCPMTCKFKLQAQHLRLMLEPLGRLR